MGSAIVPEMKVDIKTGGHHSTELVNLKTHILGKKRETKMVRAQEFHMKICGATTQARLKRKGD